MHILILPSSYPSHPNDVRGVFFRDQALVLSARGHKVGVVAPVMHSIKNFFARERPVKLPWRRHDEDLVLYMRNLWAALPHVPYGNYLLWKRTADDLLKKYVQNEGLPDIIHAHSAIYAGVVAVRWKSWLGVPVVLTEHSSAFARGMLRSWQIRLAEQAAAEAAFRIAVSPALGQILTDTFRCRVDDWNWIPNAVASRFSQGRKSKLAAHEPLRFLNLASMIGVKGQFYLMEAFATALKSIGDCELWFGGDGPLRARLEKRAERLGIEAHVRFLGRIPPLQVPELLRSVDILVVASEHETFGLAVAEALICGTPVVSTRCGGPECIVQDQDGLLVPAKDPVELSKALVYMANSLSSFNRSEISDRAMRRFSADAVGAQLEGVYADLAAKKLGRGGTDCI